MKVIIAGGTGRSSAPGRRVWLQMSTGTIYAHRYDAPNDEATGIVGGAERDASDTWRFSIDVARAWEAAAEEVVTPRTRKIVLRSAMVMSPDRGGIFDTLLGLVRPGLGGRAASGRAVHFVDPRRRRGSCSSFLTGRRQHVTCAAGGAWQLNSSVERRHSLS